MKRIFTLTTLSAMMALSASAVDASSVITEQPDGRAEEYDLHYSGFFVNLDKIDWVEDNVAQTEVVMNEAGEIYFKDLNPFIATGSYVRGDFDDEGNIVVQFPQTVLYDDDPDYGVSWIDYNIVYSSDIDEEMPVGVTDPEKNRLTFVVQADGSLIMAPLEEGYSFSGLMYAEGMEDGMWMAFSVTELTLSEQAQEPGLTPPEEAETKLYSFITLGYGASAGSEPDFGYRVKFATFGDDVYIGGLSYDLPDAWVLGHRDGNKITLANGQDMGTLSVYNAHLDFGKFDPRAQGGYSLLPADTECVFNISEDGNTISLDDPKMVLFINTLNNGEIKYLQKIEDAKFLYQPEPKGTPRNPCNLIYQERYTGENFDVLDFNLPLISTDGILLERENMYYRLFVDGEQLEILDVDFDSGIDMWDIPYDFDRYLIVSNRMNTSHELGIRIQGYDTLGVQSINVYDGEVYESEIVTIDITGAGVKGIDASEAEVEAVSYYDFSGRKVASPTGLTIKRSVMSDGSVRFSKEVVRN